MVYTITEFHLRGLPDHIKSTLIGCHFTYTYRGRHRVRERGRIRRVPIHRYMQVKFNTAQTQRLRRLLCADGFFDFFCTNNGYGAYLHQIKCFYCAGGMIAFQERGIVAPKGTYECHHRDGNTLNNDPENLIMLSVNDHKEVTMRQRGISNRRIAKHTFQASEDGKYLRTQFNRRGKPIRNHDHFLSNVVVSTLLLTNKWIYNCKGRLKDLTDWMSYYVNRLQLTFNPGVIPDTSYLPNPVFEPL